MIIPDSPWLWSVMITDRLWCLCSIVIIHHWCVTDVSQKHHWCMVHIAYIILIIIITHLTYICMRQWKQKHCITSCCWMNQHGISCKPKIFNQKDYNFNFLYRRNKLLSSEDCSSSAHIKVGVHPVINDDICGVVFYMWNP